MAWVVAQELVDHEDPFFAPVAAFVALNTPPGERGVNALQLLAGVVVGILSGEAAVAVLGGGYGSLGVATAVAAGAANALGGTRIVVGQAGVSAMLVVAIAEAEAGVDRLVDAFIGAGFALVVSQLLFAPEPIRLLRRAQTTVLRGLADSLALTARSLEEDDDELAEQALSSQRLLRDRLAELGRVRTASGRVVRRTVTWRSLASPVVQESENAAHLDLLAGSSLAVARSVAALSTSERDELAPSVRALAASIGELAERLGDDDARQRAADEGLEIARRLARTDVPVGSAPAAAIVAVRAAATDLMVFAGVDLEEAIEAVQAADPEAPVAAPAPSRRSLRSLLSRFPLPFRRRR